MASKSTSPDSISSQEGEPSWNGSKVQVAPKNQENRRQRAKNRDWGEGTYKAGMPCYNCRKAKRKCQRHGNSDCENCVQRRLLCIWPNRTFQGYRADLPQKAASNPSDEHRQEICKELETSGLGLKLPSGYLINQEDSQ